MEEKIVGLKYSIFITVTYKYYVPEITVAHFLKD